MADAIAMTLPLELRNLLIGLQGAELADNQQWVLTLLRQEGPRIVTLLWRMLGSEQDVLDAYQTAVCQMTSHGREAARNNLGGYFYRIAMNAGISMLRRRRQQRDQRAALLDVQARRQPPPPRPEQVVDQRQTIERMREAIYELPPHLRDVILMRDLGEMPYPQVAAMLNIRCGTARLYRHQAVLRLAGLMGEEASR